MATGGTTIYTSEVVHDDIQQRDLPVVKYCDSCRYDGTQEKASGFCVQCTEYLCELCFRVHGKNKTTRNHKLLKQDEMPADIDTFETINKLTKCDVHPHQDFVYECVEHKTFICVVCLSETHRTCKDIVDLSDCTEMDHVDLSMFQGNQEKLDELTSKTKCSAQEIDNRVKSVEAEINAFGKQLKQNIDYLANTLLSETKEAIKSETEKCIEAQSDCKQINTKIEKGKQLLETIKAYGTKQQIAIMARHTKLMNEDVAKDILNFNIRTPLFTLTFTKDSSLQAIKSIGTVQLLSSAEDEAACASDALTYEEHTATIRDTETVHSNENVSATSTQDNPPLMSLRQATSEKANTETSDVDGKSKAIASAAPTIEKKCRNDTKHSLTMSPVSITTIPPQSSLPFGFPKSYTPLIDRCFGQCSMIHSIRTSTDINVCEISSIRLLGNGNIVLADLSNSKVKMFSNMFDYLCEVRLPGQPIDMCIIHDEIYVCCKNMNMIFHLAFNGNTLSSNLRSYATTHQPNSVSEMDSMLLILFGNYRFDNNGNVNIQIRNGSSVPSSIHSNIAYDSSKCELGCINRAKIIYSLQSTEVLLAEDDRVSCYNISQDQNKISKRRWYYQPHGTSILDGALGLTKDSEGNVYVCGCNSNNVHQVSSQNYRVNQVVVPYIESPLSVCVDEENDRLLVGCEADDYVHSYSMM